jgi:hypothetical protein
MKRYIVKQVADEGEDVAVDAKKFDGLLGKLLSAPPLPLEKLREEPGRLAARRPKKDS